MSDQPLLETETEVFDCSTCGACCAFFWTVGLMAGDDDVPKRARRELPVLNPDTGNMEHIAVMKTTRQGACVEWMGIIGERSECRIYEHRPYVCRTFSPGNPGCIRARRHHGIGDPRREPGSPSLRSGMANSKSMNEYLGAAEMIGRQAPDVARALLAGAKFVPPPDETTKT